MLKVTREHNLLSNIHVYVYIILALAAYFFVASINSATNFVSAANSAVIETNVNVMPSLTLNIPTNTITLNLDPSSQSFTYQDLNISVGTNNPTGYNLIMSSNGTNLVNAVDNTKTISSLSNSLSESDFSNCTTVDCMNKWGFKNGLAGDYMPFVSSGTTILSKATNTNKDTTTLRFASKIDYTQMPGLYSLELDFTIVATPPTIFMNTMQELGSLSADEKDKVKDAMIENAAYTIMDSRDNQSYTIAKLKDGNVWMTQNLRLGYDENNASSTSGITTLTLTPDDSNVSASTSFNAYDFITYGSDNCAGTYNETTPTSSAGASYTTPCIHSKDTVSGDNTIGVWYNYAAATANTIKNAGDTTTTTEADQDICPKGWKMPSGSQSQALVDAIGSDPSSFDPVRGGVYLNGHVGNTTIGYWWSTTAQNGQRRRIMYYNNSNQLMYSYFARLHGFYIRCVLK